MTHSPGSTLALGLALLCTAAAATAADDPLTRPIPGEWSDRWNRAQTPVKIHGDTYYVGVAGLSSVLIRSDDGLILIDGALPQSVPLIEANIRQLGFKVEDIKYILNSHAHFDHAGGIPALQRDSGATVVASASGVQGLKLGHAVPDDPQYGYVRKGAKAPPVTGATREMRDGEVLRLGGVEITAHDTFGHTPGSTSWTWKSCENGRCVNLVYADSLNSISAPGFHYLADDTHGDLSARFRASIRKVAALPCDILITAHPDVSGLDRKLQQAQAEPNPFIDAQACRVYAERAQTMLDARIAEEKAAAAGAKPKPQAR
ncbi:subclass B3 metallo-beta-lactamase [Dokdonella ginsengisoli]|uniref:Subclass B3 metallo-beta-lactamase n=1 Tax=Dokdonella ginsengisoli TaxID=363846 RepID=A0ABV9QYK8_9GAMM